MLAATKHNTDKQSQQHKIGLSGFLNGVE